MLRRFRVIFVALVLLDAAMLGATVSEGAHYLIDVIAGSGMAFFGYAAATRIVRLEDRLLAARAVPAAGRSEAPQAV
jgi:membrane-associated phospholipid phosphatase